MKPRDLIYITLQNFKNRKSRVAFTVLGVAVAISAVFSLVSFGYGLQKNLLEQVTTEDSLLSLDIVPADADIIRLDKETIAKVALFPHVAKVSPQGSVQGEVTMGSTTSGVNINVVDADFLKFDGATFVSGRSWLSVREKKGIILSTVIANLFGIPPDQIIGKRVSINFFQQKSKDSFEVEVINLGTDYKVLGVVESKGSGNEIYMETGDAITPDGKPIEITDYPVAKVKVASSEYMVSVREELIKMGFLVSALSDIIDQANKIFGIIQVVLGIFGIIALVVAAIGLINTMTIALLERTSEIGIMRAIGAAPRDIRLLFLGESTLIGMFGGISGILIGLIASEALNWLFNLVAVSLGRGYIRLFDYPIWFSMFIIALSTIVGLIGGFWPARRAAKMNPLAALKYK